MNQEYSYILIFIIVSSLLAIILFLLSYNLAYTKIDLEKWSAYECGFNPFEDARTKFDVKFYLVAILFIIFDLEVTFLFPWTVTLNKLDNFGFYTMFVFLMILIVGFVYEWSKGALDW